MKLPLFCGGVLLAVLLGNVSVTPSSAQDLDIESLASNGYQLVREIVENECNAKRDHRAVQKFQVAGEMFDTCIAELELPTGGDGADIFESSCSTLGDGFACLKAFTDVILPACVGEDDQVLVRSLLTAMKELGDLVCTKKRNKILRFINTGMRGCDNTEILTALQQCGEGSAFELPRDLSSYNEWLNTNFCEDNRGAELATCVRTALQSCTDPTPRKLVPKIVKIAEKFANCGGSK